jgi:hypothetical protein
VNIGPAKNAGWSKEVVYNIFAESSLKFKNTDKKLFESNLRIIGYAAKQKRLPFTYSTWSTALKTYRKGGLHPVHHSPEYETQEKPHYRLVLTALLLKEIQK